MVQNCYIRLNTIEDLEQWVVSGAWIALPDMEKSLLRITVQDMAKDLFHAYSETEHVRAQQLLRRLDASSCR